MTDIECTERRLSVSSPPRKPHDYKRDRARIIHSSAFRRLQGKMQVLGIGEGDFHRTRLTHSLEVAQIGSGIVDQIEQIPGIQQSVLDILPPEALIISICLAHDIGHPPFGHAGEVALDYQMRDHGGFEGNGQSLRILSKLESHTPGYGLNLTRRTLLGVLKYPISYSNIKHKKAPTIGVVRPPEGWKPPKCYLNSESDVVDWILSPFSNADRNEFTKYETVKNDHGKPLHKSFDASIMELADDISYGIHDLEDGIVLQLISRADWGRMPQFKSTIFSKKQLANRLFSQVKGARKQAIGEMIHSLMLNVKVVENPLFGDSLLRWNVTLDDDVMSDLAQLKSLAFLRVVRRHEVRTLEWRGQDMLRQLFEAISTYPSDLLRRPDLTLYDKAEKLGDRSAALRVICDYVAGMTDEYAVRIYERLFVPRQGTIFERL